MRKSHLIPYLYLLPNIAIIVIGIMLLIITLRYSFFFYHFVRQDLGERFIGIQNYYELFVTDTKFWVVLQNQLCFTSLAIIVETIIGIVTAMLLYRQQKFRGGLLSIIMLPMLMPPVIIGLVWQFLCEPSIGFFNVLLGSLNLPTPNWFNDPNIALPLVVLTDVWQWSPFLSLAILAGLESIPPSLIESAIIDGANFWHQFRYVILPNIKYVIGVILILRFMDLLKEFDKVYTTTQGGPGIVTELLAFHIWRESFQNWYIGYGAAISIILLIISMIFVNIFVRFIKRGAQI